MYLVLAGGFWGKSRHFGRQVDPDLDSGDKMGDYVIRIEGLPEELISPEDWREKKTYICAVCGDRVVPEWEIEKREGCFLHQPKITKREMLPSYRRDVFEDYAPKKITFMRPCFRIWLNNEQGEEKFRQIWRYVEMNYPSTKIIPSPVIMGNKRELTIEEEQIPFIDLRPEEKKLDANGGILETAACQEPGCGRVFEGEKCVNQLRMHYQGKHNKTVSMHELATSQS